MNGLLHRLAVGLLFVATPLSSQAAAPTEAEAAEVFARLDRSLDAGAAADYLGEFVPEQEFLHEVHTRMVTARLASAQRARRATRVLRWRDVGEHAIVIVEHVSTLEGAPPDSASMCQHALFALRRIEGRVRPVFTVELPEADFEPDRIVCPFCNYEVDAATGWIAVPLETARSGAVEGTLFVHLGTGIALEVSVQIADRAQPASIFLQPLVDALCSNAGGKRVGATEAWMPKSVSSTVRSVSGARAEVAMPRGHRTVLHAVAMGRLGHLMLLRGPVTALAAHRASVEAMLSGYRLMSTDDAVFEQAAIALDHHCGGLLSGRDYRNPRHRIEVTGPSGWSALERCSGFLFEVVFRSPQQDGHVIVRGIAPPSGLRGWTSTMADRWLSDLCARGKRTIEAVGDSGWQDCDSGFLQRTLTLRRTDDLAAPPLCLRLLLQPSQLVVAEGETKHRADTELVEGAVGSMAPLR
ncbi:MAG: hypothetical protein ABL997_00740 [Planctomycetota bacterium]